MTTRITLKGRLAFATIREAEKYQGTGKPRFSGTVLFSKEDTKQLKKAESAMLAAATAKWAAKGAAFVASLREAQKTALTNGDLKHEYDGFEGHWAVAAHTPENTPMTLVDRTARKLDKDTQTMIYSGCDVNMIVDFWAQDNEYGKRINAQLSGIQFVADNTPFAGGTAAGSSEFEELDEPETGGFDELDEDDLA